MACANLGIANEFNIFVFGNHTQSFNDAGGRVAVGGNATYRSYGIGSALSVSTTRADLIVGGNMDIIGGTNFSGNSVISPSGTIVNYSMTNNNGVRPQPQIGTPIDFAAAEQYLTCASTTWGALAPTGTATVSFGTITLTGSSPTLNTFTIDGNNIAGSGVSLSSANGINIVTPADSTVLVNITGTGVGFGSYAIFINGGQSSPSNGAVILWNFFQATTAFNQNLSIKGSVLAPFAIWSSIGFGNIDGTLVAQSFLNTTGALEAHNVPFTGCLPEAACMPMLTVRKTVNGGASFSGTPGTPITYLIEVINTGGGILTDVVISDPLLGISQTIPSLAAGEGVNFTINSEVQPGMPGSSYQNTAFAQSNQTPQQSSSVTITIEGFMDITLIKTADRLSAAPGDTIEYTFTVENPGQVVLQNVTLNDYAIGLHLFFPTFLSGTIATFPYTVPNDAVIGSTFVNTATLAAAYLPVPVTAQASVLITEKPSVSVSKTADLTTAVPGDTIKYTVTVSNDSILTTVYNLHLTDPLLALDIVIDQLSPMASSVFVGMYTVPMGTPAGTVITNTSVLQSSLGTQSASEQVIIAADPSISITKTPRLPTVAPGETVIYDIIVTNTGNVPLTQVVVSDPGLSFSTVIEVLEIGSQNNSEASFTVPIGTPAGTKFFNTATVITNQTQPAEATSEIIVSPTFSITLMKSVAPVTAAPGDVVNYTIIVANTSNAPVTNVVVTDPTIGLQQSFSSIQEGGNIRIEVPYTIPDDSIAGTAINNIVSAVSDQTPVTTAAAQVTVTAAPGLTLIKTVAPEIANPGESVTFTLEVTNSGNTPLTDVRLFDPALGIDELIPTLAIGANRVLNISFTVPDVPSGSILTNTANAVSEQTPTPVEASASVTVTSAPSIVLTKSVSEAAAAPGQTVTFTVSLTNTSATVLTNVTIEDEFLGIIDTIDALQPSETRVFMFEYFVPLGTAAGTIFNNIATAVSDQTPIITAEAQVTVLAAPNIAIIKVANVTLAAPGEPVVYTVVVTNTGNSTLQNVVVTDDNPPLNAFIPALKRGERITFIIPFTVPEDAVPASIIINTATVTSSETPSVNANAEILVTPLPSGSISIQKLVEPRSAVPGETVAYTIIVTNNTEITLTNIHVTDPSIGIDQGISSLDPGDSLSLIASYTIPVNTPVGTQLTNTATAEVADLKVSASATVEILALPGLALTKTSDVQSPLPGTTVHYTLTVTNTGNVPVTNIDITDPQLGFATVIPSLAIGESQSFDVPFIVPDLPIGTIITNTSTAVSDQTPVPIEAEASISVGTPSTVSITKTANLAEGAPGDVIAFTIVVTNTSAIVLTNLTVVDTLLGWLDNLPTLQPGNSKTLLVQYTIPPFTLAGTTILNRATVVSDQTLPVSAEASVLVTAAPALLVRKLEDNVLSFPGNELFYTLIVENVGNIPLTQVVLTDPLINLETTVAVIQPQMTMEFRASYQIPADALAGERIINTVTATSDQTQPQQATTSITIGSIHSIAVTKTALSPTVQPGSSITFLTKITNTSNETLTNLVIEDPLINLFENVPSLAAGASISLSSIVPVATSTTIHSQITNQVNVISTQTAPTSAESTVTVLPGPKFVLTKQFPSIGLPGQQVDVILTVTNIGNQSLHGVRLTDPLLPHSTTMVEMQQAMIQTLYENYTIPSDAILGSVIVNEARVVSNETAPVTVSEELLVVGLLVEKSTSSAFTEVNNFVEFQVKVTNPTSLPAQNVLLTDPLAPGIVLVPGSVTVGGTAVAAANLGQGISLGTIGPSSNILVIFKVKIEQEQPNDKLLNQAFASFTFISDFELRGTAASNQVSIEVFNDEE